MKPDEKVLCFERKKISPKYIVRRGVFPMDESQAREVFGSMNPCFVPRSRAEHDPGFKQCIPYVLVKSGALFASYPRTGSEDRLHACWSLGFGGHVNHEDGVHVQGDFMETLRAAIARELAEELPGAQFGLPRFLGLINEEESAVGEVHLGFVFVSDIESGSTLAVSDEIRQIEWVSQADAGQGVRTYELWSELALLLLGEQPQA